MSGSWWWMLGAALLGLGGCSGTDEVYKQEAFELDSPYQLFTEAPPARACEAARRALLGQGYVIEQADGASVKGRKAFRSSADQNTVLELNIVCTDRGEGGTIFANAVEVLYRLKKSTQSASLGVPVIGSISLPVSGSSDSMVRVGDATVSDKAFYTRFFAVVEYFLEQVAETTSPVTNALPEPAPPAPPIPLPVAPTGTAPALPAAATAIKGVTSGWPGSAPGPAPVDPAAPADTATPVVDPAAPADTAAPVVDPAPPAGPTAPAGTPPPHPVEPAAPAPPVAI